jgi:hypothetical protein
VIEVPGDAGIAWVSKQDLAAGTAKPLLSDECKKSNCAVERGQGVYGNGDRGVGEESRGETSRHEARFNREVC